MVAGNGRLTVVGVTGGEENSSLNVLSDMSLRYHLPTVGEGREGGGKGEEGGRGVSKEPLGGVPTSSIVMQVTRGCLNSGMC